MVEHTTSTPYISVMDQYGYQIGKVIGHGSYGTVYEAYFAKQKTMVAIKIISKKKASEDYLTKFLPREIQVSYLCGRRWLRWGLGKLCLEINWQLSPFESREMCTPQFLPRPSFAAVFWTS